MKCFIIETVIWKWLLSGLFRLEPRPIPERLENTHNKRVLLVGCGPGHVSTGPSIRDGAQITATDLSFPFVQSCQKYHPDWSIYCGDLTQLPHGENQFDMVVIYSTLHHIPLDAIEVFRELARVSKHRLVILEGIIPQHGILRRALLIWYGLVDGGHHYYTRSELEDRFSELGFKLERQDFYSPIAHMMLCVLDVSNFRAN